MIRSAIASRLPRFRKSAVCIGIFDGVHAGHRKIIRQTVERARRLRIPSVGLTFDPHPSRILTPGQPHTLLYSLRHRLVHMKEEGLDHCLVLKFTRGFSRIPAERFARDVLKGRLGAAFVCVGEDFRFGRGAEGGVEHLASWSKRLGYRLKAVGAVKLGGHPVSSTRIRALIAEGKLKDAGRLLGRPVSLFGSIVRGEGRGRRIGFPTVNLRLHHETLPPPGVYAAQAVCEGRRYAGVLHLGPRPTFFQKAISAEAHLFGVHKSFYGKEMEIFVSGFIRKIRRFPDAEALKNQIRKDIRSAKNILRNPYKPPLQKPAS